MDLRTRAAKPVRLPAAPNPAISLQGPMSTKENFLYTDQPPVISRAAIDHVGYYLEIRNLETCEEDYNRRWRDQSRFATAIFPAYYIKVYLHEDAAHSFRTGRFRQRLDSYLMPAALVLKQHCRPLYHWTCRHPRRHHHR